MVTIGIRTGLLVPVDAGSPGRSSSTMCDAAINEAASLGSRPHHRRAVRSSSASTAPSSSGSQAHLDLPVGFINESSSGARSVDCTHRLLSASMARRRGHVERRPIGWRAGITIHADADRALSRRTRQ